MFYNKVNELLLKSNKVNELLLKVCHENTLRFEDFFVGLVKYKKNDNKVK